MRLLLLLTMMSGFVPVARADALGDAIAVLKSFAATAERDAAAARFAAYGLDAHAPRPVEWSSAAPFDRDVAALAGCKRLDDVERARVRADIEAWVTKRLRKGRVFGHVWLAAGCWVGGEMVLAHAIEALAAPAPVRAAVRVLLRERGRCHYGS